MPAAGGHSERARHCFARQTNISVLRGRRAKQENFILNHNTPTGAERLHRTGNFHPFRTERKNFSYETKDRTFWVLKAKLHIGGETMAKYIGSKGEVQIPERIGTTSRQETDQQVSEWLRVLIWGVSADEIVSRKLENESAELYIFDDKGKLIPAIGEEEKLNDRMVGKRLLEHAQGGQLFIRALGENGLRQVTTDANYNIGLSKEIGTDTKFPKVEIPEAPKRPFFLKFLLPFLFRNEIDHYNAKKAEYDEAVKRDQWTRNFDAPENKAILSGAAEKEQDRYDYEERFEKKQELRQKEIDAEIEREQVKNAKQIQEQMVVSNSKQAAENIREQRKDYEVSSVMCKGLLSLGHPDMAEGTGYRSYEQLLQDLDKGGSVNPQIQNGAQNPCPMPPCCGLKQIYPFLTASLCEECIGKQAIHIPNTEKQP
ncbi:MAG: hypothetical protein IIX70_08590, partial [Oscillospiraceae bacterium]|nr:hypothetical protein [Oscillospiraceae bacterium]